MEDACGHWASATLGLGGDSYGRDGALHRQASIFHPLRQNSQPSGWLFPWCFTLRILGFHGCRSELLRVASVTSCEPCFSHTTTVSWYSPNTRLSTSLTSPTVQ